MNQNLDQDQINRWLRPVTEENPGINLTYDIIHELILDGAAVKMEKWAEADVVGEKWKQTPGRFMKSWKIKARPRVWNIYFSSSGVLWTKFFFFFYTFII